VRGVYRNSRRYIEMEFLDMTRVFRSMLFTVSSTGGFYRKPYSTPVLNSIQKKSAKLRKLESFHK